MNAFFDTPRSFRKKRRQQRLFMIFAGVGLLFLAIILMMLAFRDNLVFFFSPSELLAAPPNPGEITRLGGLVEEGSLTSQGANSVTFAVSDGSARIIVNYKGVLPDLFREGQGVVVEGEIGPDNSFTALQVLAKHDETYMPREVADALKEQGHWRTQDGKRTPP